MLSEGNPFLNRLNAQSKSAHGGKSEKRLAKNLGARLQPASGALSRFKSDMVVGRYRIESKSTTNNTLALALSWLHKITSEALSSKQVPVVTISFVTPEGKPQDLNAEWVLMPMYHFKDLTEGE
jgi:hypothetical protein